MPVFQSVCVYHFDKINLTKTFEIYFKLSTHMVESWNNHYLHKLLIFQCVPIQESGLLKLYFLNNLKSFLISSIPLKTTKAILYAIRKLNDFLKGVYIIEFSY